MRHQDRGCWLPGVEYIQTTCKNYTDPTVNWLILRHTHGPFQPFNTSGQKLKKGHEVDNPLVCLFYAGSDSHNDNALMWVGFHCYPPRDRLVHNPTVVAVSGAMRHGLQLSGVACWWLADPNIDWGTPYLHRIMGKLQCVMGACDRLEFLPFFKSKCLPPGLCNGTV